MVDTRSIVSSIPTKGLWAPNSVFFGDGGSPKDFAMFQQKMEYDMEMMNDCFT